jgi:hypothetical protein
MVTYTHLHVAGSKDKPFKIVLLSFLGINTHGNTLLILDNILKLDQICPRYSKIFSFTKKAQSHSPANSTNRFLAKSYLWKHITTEYVRNK